MKVEPKLLDIEAAEYKRIKRIRDFLIDSTPKIDIDRAEIYTKVYNKNKSRPKIIVRALALKELLNYKKIKIYDDELIVGNPASAPRSACIFPEYAVDYILKELDGDPYAFDKRPGDIFKIDKESNKKLRDLCRSWKGNTSTDMILSQMPEQTRKVYESGIINTDWLLSGGQGHLTPDFKLVLNKGLVHIHQKADFYLSNLDISDPQASDRISFYKSIKIVVEAIRDYASRFSSLADRMSKTEKDKKRKDELKTIARICKKVPYHPADDLFEALQSIWFVQSILQMEDSGHSMSLGRLDQTLYPYYLNTMDKGMELEDIIGLLSNFWLKLFEVNKVRSWDATQYFAGYPMFQNITIGGQKDYGEDATNELSYLILMTQSLLQLPAPSISLRYHNNIDELLLDFTTRVIGLGGGQPAIYNDEVLIPSLISRGFEVEDALNYSIVGCVEPHVEGKQGYRPNGACFFNLPKILEITLNDGKDKKTGNVFMKPAKAIGSIVSFEELYSEIKSQIRYFMKHHVFMDNLCSSVFLNEIPNALVSSLISDCVDKGKTIDQGGAKYEMMGNLIIGLANLGNSLAAIKKIVFDEKKVTMAELQKALDDDFNTDENKMIRKLLLESPKFGNDDDYVDSITSDIFELICREYQKNKTIRYGKGPICGHWVPSTSTVSANVPFGKLVCATPDGRKDGEPLADGISPYMGTDRLGPTAVIRSIGKLNNILVTGGQLLNMKFSASVLKDKNRALIDLIRTYAGDYKGMHIQFNILDSRTLKQAQSDPRKFKNLMVRVAGYSALFVDLDKEVQDMIIKRTEHLGL